MRIEENCSIQLEGSYETVAKNTYCWLVSRKSQLCKDACGKQDCYKVHCSADLGYDWISLSLEEICERKDK